MKYKEWTVYHDVKRDKYPRVVCGGRSIAVHVLVWEEANGPKPKGYDIHHKDENKGNWSLDNLELLLHKDHIRLHHGWIRTGGEWTHKPCNKCGFLLPVSEFYSKSYRDFYGECKVCHIEATSRYQKANKSKKREYGRQWRAKHGEEFNRRRREKRKAWRG